jgi:hypothetical protein
MITECGFGNKLTAYVNPSLRNQGSNGFLENTLIAS